jgi:hypothetical protein
MRHLLLALVVLLSNPVAPAVAQLPEIPGCYRADRALGTSAMSAFGRGVAGPVGLRTGEDSASLPRLRTFRLLEGGRVERPDADGPELWARGSRWEYVGDTLRITLSTLMSGWQLQLTRVPGADGEYAGTARYLTDVVVKDGPGPLEVPVRVRREPCAPRRVPEERDASATCTDDCR